MTIFRFSTAILLSCIASSGCSGEPADTAKPDMTICASKEQLLAPKGFAGDPLAQVENAEKCVKRWAYKLGVAPGSNAEIAKAAVRSCRKEIYLIPTAGSEEFMPPTVDQVDEEIRAMSELAVDFVIQGRAGNCGSIVRNMK